MTSSIPAVGTRTAEAATLQAVFLDLDGTLVDTEGFWWEAEAEVFATLGHTLDERHRTVVVGGPMSRSAGYLIRATGADIGLAELSTLLNAAFAARIARGVELMPGARRLLSELAAHRVPTALVTASHRTVVGHMLRSLGPENFRLTVAGDDLVRTKPHPDPYLTAAARLGVDPARCAVVEDTLTGVRAGEAAGCRVVAVPSVTPVPPAPGRTVVGSLEEVDLPFLQALITESRGTVH
ncbi:HAD family phosphatase [Streptomyces sp. RS10V-4]|uniref:HAD family hydrolase n=1 Tax=Streptomyces rhizoryzae TaxID=2932493 RepID=UPI002004F318|nr:HAD family phosphatase [Streptomyces rhizoryzae]MCK7623119.1 HAD family phosphatase [Streptomyces rhizoryzae]